MNKHDTNGTGPGTDAPTEVPSFGGLSIDFSNDIAAVPLALVDPGAARTILKQIEERSGLDPPALVKIAGDNWLRAWALVDLEKAATLFEAELAALEKTKGLNLQTTGFFNTVELLAAPPHRREAVVYGDQTAAWYPGHSL